MKYKSYIVCLIACCVMACFGKRPTITTGHEGKAMPSINLLLTDSVSYLNTKNIPNGEPIVLFYFSPHCPYCRSLTKEIITNIKNLEDIHFYMLSNFPLSYIKDYKDEYQLDKYHNITVAQDYEIYFSTYFKAPGVPCIAIYGKERKLKQVVMGKVSTSLIKDIAFE